MSETYSKPTWEPIELRCKVCNHQWQDWQPGHVPAKTWIAHVETFCCRECGGDYTALLIVNQPATSH